MISKTVKYTMILVLLSFFSCKKGDSDSDLEFSKTCDFSGSEVEIINKTDGTISYTDNISGTTFYGGGYRFVINSPGLLKMVVCNMPDGFEMDEGAERNITFSGRILALGDETDAMNTDIELYYLKFK